MVNLGKAGRMLPKEEMEMNRKGALVGRSRSRNWRRREKRGKKKMRRTRTNKRKRRRLRELWLRKT